MKFFLSLILLLASFSLAGNGSAWAVSQSCYSSTETIADAAMRYQAYLRVIGLSCTSPATGKSLFNLYDNFTRNNEKLLSRYDKTMENYFSSVAKSNSGKQLKKFETEIGNDQSLSAAKMETLNFCSAHRDDLEKAATASAAQVERDIENFAASNPASVRQCIER